jgi:hypothetical protein
MKIPSNANPEIQGAFREVWDTLNRFNSKDINLNGRRIINAGSAVEGSDYIRSADAESAFGFNVVYNKLKAAGLDDFPGQLRELQPSKVTIVTSTTTPRQTDSGKLFYETDTGALKFCTGSGYVTITYNFSAGTYVTRPSATTLSDGVIYYSTDSTTLFIVNTGAWVYLAGAFVDTLAYIPTLGTGDADFIFFPTDYEHFLRWTGAAWQFKKGDDGSRYYRDTDGTAPTVGVWGLCDGSTYACLNADGTTTNVTPATVTNRYIRR